MLDEAGFQDARIVASNDLDENLINSLHEQGARIDTWGIGTKLVTAFDQPALGGVYKLGAVKEPVALPDHGGGAGLAGEPTPGRWRDVIKLSEQPIKISTPGLQAVQRFSRGGVLVGDVIHDATVAPPGIRAEAWDLEDPTRGFVIDGDVSEPLLQTMMTGGVPTAATASAGDLPAARARADADRAALSPRTRRHLNPQPDPVGLDASLHQRKLRLVAEARAAVGQPVSHLVKESR